MEISEKLISQIWEYQLLGGKELVTTSGEPLWVIHPGKKNQEKGPDFKDAIIAIGKNTLMIGDVEVHTKSSRWWVHKHQNDPFYDRVALHFVCWHDTQKPVCNLKGKLVPTLSFSFNFTSNLEELKAWIENLPPVSFICPAAKTQKNSEKTLQLLEAAGRARFQWKVAYFQNQMVKMEPEQVLYQGIMGALGYRKNKKAFESLAQELPVSLLMETDQRESSLLIIQALLLGTAGLLPSQRGKRYQSEGWEVNKLEEIWQSLGKDTKMRESDWHFIGVRPENFPTRRLIAQSYLLRCYQKSRLVQGMHELITKAEKPHHLEKGIIIKTNGYWAEHYDFNVKAKRRSAILGQGRAAELIVNVLLPFYYAWAEATSEAGLKKKTLAFYYHYPSLEENILTWEMKKRLFPESNFKLKSACIQQGLIHLHKNYCYQRKCSQCPMQTKANSSWA